MSANVVVLPGTEEAMVMTTGVLLSKPRQTLPAEATTVYGLRRGKVGSMALGRYSLPESMRADTLVFPGHASAAGAQFLRELASHADRIAPWVRVDVVPRLAVVVPPGSDYGDGVAKWHVGTRTYTSAGGLAFPAGDMVLLQLADPANLLGTLFHELMHMCWGKLSEEARNVIAAAVEQGPRWPGNYFGDTEERACRLFESWAFSQAAGMPGYQFDDTELTAHRVFSGIYTGAFADELIASGAVQVSFSVRAARGLLSPPPPAPPLADCIASAAWRWARDRLREKKAA